MTLLFLALLRPILHVAPQIAFIAHHRLYVLDCQSSGVPARGVKPYPVCNVGSESELAWTPRGEIMVGNELNGYLLIRATKGKSSIRKIPPDHHESAHVESRIPSPAGPAEIVLWTYPSGKSIWKTDAYIVGGTRHKKRLLAAEIDGTPEWSPKGDLIALVRADDPGGNSAELIAYPSLKVRLKRDPVVNTWWNEFSPDGRWISESGGPLEYRGTSLLSVRTGQTVAIDIIPGYQTFYIDEWSPDGRHFIESYGAQDAEDRWTKSTSAIGDIVTHKSKRIPGSERAGHIDYAKDGRHFIWHSSTSDELLLVDVAHPSHRRIIAYDVASFAPSWR